MTFVYLICFLLLAVGAVLLLKLTPERITGDLMRFVSPKQTLRDKVLTRKLFFEWGIQFEKEPFVVPLRDNKDVCYADRDTLMRLVYEKYASKQKKDEDEIPPSSISVEQVLSEQNNPPSDRPHDIPEGAKLHNAPRPEELP